MKKKKVLYFIVVGILALTSLFSAYYAGYKVGKNNPRTIIIKDAYNIKSADSKSADFSNFWKVWDLIDKNYLKNNKITAQDKVNGAIDGLVRSLRDPYSEFFDPSHSKIFQEDVNGSFGGVGIEIGIRNNQLTVISPLKGTPGEKAGLKAGDKILMVNSSSTDDIPIDEVVQWIRGKIGTNVSLTILRDGWDEPKKIGITRANIEIPTIDYRIDNGVLRLKIYSFNANLPRLFYNAMLKTLPKGVNGVVLDLRDNPGGYLDVAVNIAGWFLPNNTLVVSEVPASKADKREFRTKDNGILSDIPVVVLINKGSASASEILAGALRDQRGIKLVGEQSFGKGTVQELMDLQNGSSLKLTIANWVLPKGQILEGNGLKPDYEVKMSDSDIENGKDPQMDKAIEILNSEINHR